MDNKCDYCGAKEQEPCKPGCPELDIPLDEHYYEDDEV